jgi:heme-degrading monooxygenase HmoA
MITVITTTKLKAGTEHEWDAAMRERFTSAHERQGWVSSQLLAPVGAPESRVLIGTWSTRDDWQAWHNTAAFLDQRGRLEALEAEPSTSQWYTVVASGRADLG